jgi:PPP family 3-phenylpropionic acid transporter
MPLPPLSPEQRIKPRHFELRVALIFAFLFIPQGVHLPFFPVWLEAKGYDAGQIALILSLPMFLRVLTTPFVTAFADKARDRADVLVVLVALSLAVASGYLLFDGYAAVLAISILLAIAWTPHSPLTDSLALSGVRRFGSNYTGMRLWGSTAFLLANLAGGVIVARAGADVVPLLIVIGLCGTLAAATLAPRLGRPRLASPLSATDLQASPSLMNRYFLFLVGGAGLITSSHALLYGFSSIYWKSLGIAESTVGILWAWSVICEVALFLAFTRLLGHMSATALIAVAGAFAVLRWLAFPLVWPSGLGVTGFFAVQALHAFSTGVMLIAVQKLIAESVPEERTGAAQGIAFFANGMSMALFTLASGPLYDHFGAGGFYVMAAAAAVGLALIRLAGPAPQVQPHRSVSGGETSDPS